MQHYRLYSVPTMRVGNVPNFIAGNVPSEQVGNACKCISAACKYILYTNLDSHTPTLSNIVNVIYEQPLALPTYTYLINMLKEGVEKVIQAMLPESYKYKFEKCECFAGDKVCLEAKGKCFKSDKCEAVSGFLVQAAPSTCRVADQTSTRRVTGQKCMKVVCSGNKERQPGKNTDRVVKINLGLKNPVSKCAEQRMDKDNFPLWIKIELSHTGQQILYPTTKPIPEACTLSSADTDKTTCWVSGWQAPQMFSGVSSYSYL